MLDARQPDEQNTSYDEQGDQAAADYLGPQGRDNPGYLDGPVVGMNVYPAGAVKMIAEVFEHAGDPYRVSSCLYTMHCLPENRWSSSALVAAE
jgi:hypothetical protein